MSSQIYTFMLIYKCDCYCIEYLSVSIEKSLISADVQNLFVILGMYIEYTKSLFITSAQETK